MDPRIRQLAQMLVTHSVHLQRGERVLISAGPGKYTEDMVRALLDEVYAVGGHPFVDLRPPASIARKLLHHATPERYELLKKWEEVRFQDINAYISFGQNANLYDYKDIDADTMQLIGKIMQPLNNYLLEHTKWVGLGWPNDSFAQSAEMPTESFEDFYFKVCTVDYATMDRAMEPLKRLMESTDKVRLVGPGDTNLTFSIKGMPAIKCAGQHNVPDGECFTAPVRDSVNGVIHFNTTSLYQGFVFKDVRLVFQDGKIVEATANDTDRINKIFDIDAGARYVGEFSLGFNPYIMNPMNSTLFDEKIAGSLHVTPGRAYKEADNGNKSTIHWDMVLIQRPEYGGGEIYFDDRLIRKDGLFVVPELRGLNPEHLVG